MTRLAALLFLVSMSVACQSAAVVTPSPTPVAAVHTAITETTLQQVDVPSGLAQCADSGSISAYIAAVKAANASTGGSLATQWKALQSRGAQQGQITLFTGAQSACAAELGASGSVKSAASLIVAFADEGQADRAWQSGVFGFTPPAPGAAPPGITRGAGTGLGDSSFSYVKAPVQLAVWRKSVFVAIVAFANLDAASFKAATAAVDARLN